MSIQWKQTAWFSVKGSHEKKPWRWEGHRSDGRSFKIVYISRLDLPYRACSYNGAHVGEGKTLADAQRACMAVPGAKVPVKVAKPV